jgi:hypothetical protein
MSADLCHPAPVQEERRRQQRRRQADTLDTSRISTEDDRRLCPGRRWDDWRKST